MSLGAWARRLQGRIPGSESPTDPTAPCGASVGRTFRGDTDFLKTNCAFALLCAAIDSASEV
jgi:hypothetical protein